jgi:uncharacterized protein YceK
MKQLLMVFMAVVLAAGCNTRKTATIPVPDAYPSIAVPTHNVSDKRSGVTTCAVHNVALVENTIPNHTLYSVEYEQKYHEAMLARFPNLGDSFGERDKTITHILYNYCPKCGEACQEYSKENP